MVKFNDIIRTSSYRSNRLCASDVEALTHRAVCELVKRSIAGAVTVSFCFILMTVATGYPHGPAS